MPASVLLRVSVQLALGIGGGSIYVANEHRRERRSFGEFIAIPSSHAQPFCSNPFPHKAPTPDPVELKNSAESRRVAIVIAQESTEALATPHRTAVTPQAWLGCDELVGEALMIALGMIVGQVLVEHI
jgi:hypothetical protein